MNNLFYHLKGRFHQYPKPPKGHGYMVIPMPNEILDKVSRLEAGGHYERELRVYLTDAVKQFFVTRGITIETQVILPQGLKLYDPRDPLKERIN